MSRGAPVPSFAFAADVSRKTSTRGTATCHETVVDLLSDNEPDDVTALVGSDGLPLSVRQEQQQQRQAGGPQTQHAQHAQHRQSPKDRGQSAIGAQPTLDRFISPSKALPAEEVKAPPQGRLLKALQVGLGSSGVYSSSSTTIPMTAWPSRHRHSPPAGTQQQQQGHIGVSRQPQQAQQASAQQPVDRSQGLASQRAQQRLYEPQGRPAGTTWLQPAGGRAAAAAAPVRQAPVRRSDTPSPLPSTDLLWPSGHQWPTRYRPLLPIPLLPVSSHFHRDPNIIMSINC